jgi:hypothetical protein
MATHSAPLGMPPWAHRPQATEPPGRHSVPPGHRRPGHRPPGHHRRPGHCPSAPATHLLSPGCVVALGSLVLPGGSQPLHACSSEPPPEAAPPASPRLTDPLTLTLTPTRWRACGLSSTWRSPCSPMPTTTRTARRRRPRSSGASNPDPDPRPRPPPRPRPLTLNLTLTPTPTPTPTPTLTPTAGASSSVLRSARPPSRTRRPVSCGRNPRPPSWSGGRHGAICPRRWSSAPHCTGSLRTSSSR